MKINGRIHLTFKKLSEALGLPDNIEIEMISCSPEDMATNYFTVHLFDANRPELPLGNIPPYLECLSLELDATQEARAGAVSAVVSLYRKMSGETVGQKES